MPPAPPSDHKTVPPGGVAPVDDLSLIETVIVIDVPMVALLAPDRVAEVEWAAVLATVMGSQLLMAFALKGSPL